mgnify:CR=1 FL=1
MNNNQQNTNTAAKKTKKKKRKNKHSKVGMFFFGLFSICAMTVLVVVSYVLFHVITTVNGDLIVNLEEEKSNQNQTSFIYAYDANGNEVELARLHGEEDRVWVDLDDMSPYMKNAFMKTRIVYLRKK